MAVRVSHADLRITVQNEGVCGDGRFRQEVQQRRSWMLLLPLAGVSTLECVLTG